MAQWYYGENGVQHGPADEAQIAEMVRTQRLSATTPVWREGMSTWKSLAEVQAQGELVGGQQGSPYQTPAAASYNPAAPAPTSGLAIASLVCGIVGLVSCMVFIGFPAVICGHLALSNIDNSPTPIAGRGLAIAGLITGYLGVLATLAFAAMLVTGVTSSF